MMTTELNETQGFIGVTLYLVLVVVALTAAWRIYVKMGRRGWEALIPIYNLVIFYKCVWGSGWYLLLTLIPVVGPIIALVTLFKLYRGFHKGLIFSWLGLIFSPIAFLIVAFDSSWWHGGFC